MQPTLLATISRGVSAIYEHAPSRPAPPAKNSPNSHVVPREARLPGAREALLGRAPGRNDSRALRAAEQAGAVLFVTVLTAIAAQISVPLPFTPVPFTFQPMVVLVGAAALGSRLGMVSQIAYLGLGIAGLPMFAASSVLPQGAARLLGPTGGYLMAYPFAAFVAGWLAERGFDRRYLTAVLAMICGLAVVFAGGVLWLAFFAHPAMGVGAAVRVGFTPFIAADLLKLLAAAGVMPGLWWLKKSHHL